VRLLEPLGISERLVRTSVYRLAQDNWIEGVKSGRRSYYRLTGLTMGEMDLIELNEALAAQALAVLRELDLPDDAPQVNPNGDAIALGHPLGMTGARRVTAAMYQLKRSGGRYALCTLCVGVGQGVAIIMEKV
jgi:acetyl-CoA C-acetyltransferase